MNHSQLIKMAHALGYTPEASGITDAGICKGFAMLWIRAACSGKLEDFNKRMQILELYHDRPAELIEQINRSRKATDEFEFNEPFRQIHPFFENIALFLHPDEHPDILGRGLNPHDEEAISAFIDNDQPEVKISNCHRRVNNYDEQQLEVHLIELAKTLTGQPGCAIEFNSLRHSVSAYLNEEGKFVFLDVNPDTSAQINDMQMLVLTPKEVADYLMQKSFYFDKKEEQLAMSTTIYARSDIKSDVSAKFQEVYYQLTSNLDVNMLNIGFKTPGMAQAILMQSDFNVHDDNNSLLMLAINYNNQELVDAILQHEQFDPTNIDFSYLACSFTKIPLENIKAILTLFVKAGLATETMNNTIYRALSQDKETDNFSLMRALLEMENPLASALIIKRLITDGYDFMRNTSTVSPLHKAFEDDQIEIVKIFIDAGYDPNSLNGTSYPLLTSLSSPIIVQFLLDNGANPQPNMPYVKSALDIACIRDSPLETLKVLMKHESTQLTMHQITVNSLIYKTIQEKADIELTNEFVIKALHGYINGIKEEPGIGVFFTKDEKMIAAQALLSYLKNGTPIDPTHNKALNDGRLSQIAVLIPANISKIYRAKIQEQRQKLTPEEPVDNTKTLR